MLGLVIGQGKSLFDSPVIVIIGVYMRFNIVRQYTVINKPFANKILLTVYDNSYKDEAEESKDPPCFFSLIFHYLVLPAMGLKKNVIVLVLYLYGVPPTSIPMSKGSSKPSSSNNVYVTDDDSSPLCTT